MYVYLRLSTFIYVYRRFMYGCQTLKIGDPKIKNRKYNLNGGRAGPGNVITHPHVGVPGADGTTAVARRGHAGKLFMIFWFSREREREREILPQKTLTRFIV